MNRYRVLHADFRRVRWTLVFFAAACVIAAGVLADVGSSSLKSELGAMVLFSMALVALCVFLLSALRMVRTAQYRIRRSHRDLRLIQSLSNALMDLAESDSLPDTALQAQLQLFDADSAAVCLLQPERAAEVRVAGADVPEQLKQAIAGAVSQAPSHRNSRPIVVAEISEAQPAGLTLRRAMQQAGFETGAGVWFASDATLRGAAFLFYCRKRMYGPGWIQLLQMTGQQLAYALALARARQGASDLRALEERERLVERTRDNFTQVLAYVNAETSAVSRLLTDGNVTAAKAEIQRLRDAARSALQDARKLSLQSRSTNRRPGSFAECIKECATHFTELSGIPVSFDWSEAALRSAVSEQVETQAARMVQDALNDVQRRPGGNRVNIAVALEGPLLTLRLEEFSTRPDPRAVSGEDHDSEPGSANAESSSAGQDVWIESRFGEGCRLSIAMPALEG